MNLEQLNENRIEQALIFLAGSDEDHAKLSGEVKYLEEAIKQAKAHSFLEAEGTVAERDAKALASLKYDLAIQTHLKAYVDFKQLDNQRNHEIRIIDIWRTLSSNRRQGNL